MNFEEYITRYRLIQKRISEMKRQRILYDDNNYRLFVENFRKTGRMDEDDTKKLLRYENLDKKRRRLENLASHYAWRIFCASQMIKDVAVREYAILRYVYGVSNEAIAEATNYSERSVYRHGLGAKKELPEKLALVMPHSKRTKNKKYRFSKRPEMRDYTVTPAMRRELNIFRTSEAKPMRIKCGSDIA